jgi:glycine cleavage system H protein
LIDVEVPDDLLYSSDHEWVRVDGGRARIGITDYAQDALGDVVFVQAPDIGRKVAAGESFSEVESTKSVSDIYAPVAGSISAINDALADDPSLVNTSPYVDGWICDIDLDSNDLSHLMSAADYRKLIS